MKRYKEEIYWKLLKNVISFKADIISMYRHISYSWLRLNMCELKNIDNTFLFTLINMQFLQLKFGFLFESGEFLSKVGLYAIVK